MAGQWIDVAASDGSGSFRAYLALPASGQGPGIVLAQEIFGINATIVTAEVNVRADWELIGIISLAVIVGTLFVAGIVRTVIGRRRRRADASGSGLGLESESGSKSESGSGDGNG